MGRYDSINPEAPFDGGAPDRQWLDAPAPHTGDFAWLKTILLVFGFALIFLGLLVYAFAARARDLGQWDASDPIIKLWFSQLKQPDTIGIGDGVSCCGESDAYWADKTRVEADAEGKPHIYATITDERDDGPLMRIHEEIGTEYEVPASKIVGKEQRLGNPTGHIVIFLGVKQWIGATHSKRPVLCWVDNGGV